MTDSTLRNAAEATWDEEEATPARAALTPPVPRSERPPSEPPAHHPASTDVTSLRKTVRCRYCRGTYTEDSWAMGERIGPYCRGCGRTEQAA